MKKIQTATGHWFRYDGTPHTGTTIYYNSGDKYVDAKCYNLIISIFKEKKGVCLGANMTGPKKGGLGEIVHNKCKCGLTPRNASHIAAILHDHGYLTWSGKSPVILNFR
jgi:hypothetical protein